MLPRSAGADSIESKTAAQDDHRFASIFRSLECFLVRFMFWRRKSTLSVDRCQGAVHHSCSNAMAMRFVSAFGPQTRFLNVPELEIIVPESEIWTFFYGFKLPLQEDSRPEAVSGC